MWARIIQGLVLSPLLANSRAVIWFQGFKVLVFQVFFFFLLSPFGYDFGFGFLFSVF
jgi:hypothetical protein